MPFVRKTDANRLKQQKNAHTLFIGRTNELLFFVQSILKPDDPIYNIISISGQGGVGKSTLLKRFIDETHISPYKDYCITSLVDERQATPISIMEKIADQLHLKGQFEKALKRYKETLRQLHAEREKFQDDLLQRVPDIAGAIVEGIPFAGPLLREGAKVTTKHLLGERQISTSLKDGEAFDYILEELTNAFISELNQLADTAIILDSRTIKRRRVILFFDTFERLAVEVVPWLLDYFLEAEINSNIVLVIAGRHPIDYSTRDNAKHWLSYIESGVIFSFILNSFTKEETHTYLTERGIIDLERIDTIWKLSLGLPLYLGFLTSHPQGKVDPAKDVVDNFLRWIPEQEHVKRQLALDAALFSRPFNQDDLEAFTYLPKDEYTPLFRWLIEQPFVRSQDGRYSYHEVARDLFSRHLYQRSKKEFYATRRTLAKHYEQLIKESHLEEDKATSNSSEWLELSLALVQQLFFLPDKANNTKIIEYVLSAYYNSDTGSRGEIINVLHGLRGEQFSNKNSTQEIIEQLLHYIDAGIYNRTFMIAADYLFEKVVHEADFSAKLLKAMHQQRGRALLSIGEYQQAVEDFNRTLELDPLNIEAFINKGWAYSKLKEYEKAIGNIECALSLDPSSESAYRCLGEIYFKLNDYRQAITCMNHIIEQNPHSAWAYRCRGWTYYIFNKYQQAIADFDRALDIEPNHAQAYIERGWIYELLKEYRRAIVDFDRALKLIPNHVQALGYRCQAHTQLQEFQLAIADSNHLVELDPYYSWSYHIRGRIFLALKEYQPAIENFNRALELNPNYGRAYDGRGLAYLWLKDTKQAKSNYAAYLVLVAASFQTPQWFRTNSSWPRIEANWLTEWIGMCEETPDLATAKRLEAIAATDPEHYIANVCRGVAM